MDGLLELMYVTCCVELTQHHPKKGFEDCKQQLREQPAISSSSCLSVASPIHSSLHHKNKFVTTLVQTFVSTTQVSIKWKYLIIELDELLESPPLRKAKRTLQDQLSLSHSDSVIKDVSTVRNGFTRPTTAAWKAFLYAAAPKPFGSPASFRDLMQ